MPYSLDDDPYAKGHEKGLREMYERGVQVYSSDEEDEYHNIKFQSGSESARRCQALWERRFDLFYRLHISNEGPITINGTYLVRFLNFTIRSIKRYNKGSVSYLVVKSAIERLRGYAVNDFNITFTPQDNQKLKGWFTKKLDKKQIRKGKVFPKNRLTFSLVNKMMVAHLSKAIRKGTISYDQVFADMLGVSLLTGLGCRNGDISCAQYYGGEGKECFLKYKHISLYLDDPNGQSDGEEDYHSDNEWEGDGDKDFEGETDEVFKTLKKYLRCRISLYFIKGSKLDVEDDDGTHANVNNIKPFSALIDHPHLCIITNLLIHSFRHGLIKGNPKTPQELLDLLLRSPSRQVEWNFPDFPVICAFGESVKNPSEGPPTKKQCKASSTNVSKCRPNFLGKGRYLNLSQPAGGLLLRTVKRMAKEAGILGYVRTHSIRCGAIRDSTYIKEAPTGYVGKRSSAMAFHAQKTVDNGITDGYAGASSEPVYNLIEINCSELNADDLPIAAEPFVARKIPDEEVKLKMTSMIDEGKLEIKNDSKKLHLLRRRAIAAIHKEDYNSYEERMRPTATRGPSSGPLKEVSSSAMNTMNNGAIYSKTDGREEKKDEEGDEEDFDEADQEMFQKFFANQDDITEEEEKKVIDDRVATFLDCCDRDDDVPNTFSSFIEFGRRANIFYNDRFARAWPHYKKEEGNFDDTIGPFCTIGNSRDDPTPFEIRCPYCSYTSLRKDPMSKHINICANNPNKEPKQKPVKVTKELKEVICPDCKKTYKEGESIRKHKTRIHKEFVCTKCSMTFTGQNRFDKHAGECGGQSSKS